MNSKLPVEKWLQTYRFNIIRKYLFGRILDFGCNNQELQLHYNLPNYTGVNSISEVKGEFDTIVVLAVIEHMDQLEGIKVIDTLMSHLGNNGVLVLTTPSPISKYILEVLSFFRLIDKDNLKEHKYYWSKRDLLDSFKGCEYKKFQFGLNQLVAIWK